MDNSKGRYWDKPWSLVDGCTPCSPGCDHCWALGMEKRFHKGIEGVIKTHPERLDIPMRTRKPTVFSAWNDLFHEDVPGSFVQAAYTTMAKARQHTFLVLTKRARRMADITTGMIEVGLTLRSGHGPTPPNVWHGCTVCNQSEADAKIMYLMDVPGKKFLSIEPMLGPIDLTNIDPLPRVDHSDVLLSFNCLTGHMKGPDDILDSKIDAVILGGESGPGARPLHPDWIRSVRDQCNAAGVPFYFKQWGEWGLGSAYNKKSHVVFHDGQWTEFTPERMHKIAAIHGDDYIGKGSTIARVGSRKAGRMLDGRTHDELVWRVEFRRVDKAMIDHLISEGHTRHCACRQVWGDGECSCELEKYYDPYWWTKTPLRPPFSILAELHNLTYAHYGLTTA